MSVRYDSDDPYAPGSRLWEEQNKAYLAVGGSYDPYEDEE